MAAPRFAQPGATVRYLPQEPDLSGYATTRDYVEAGLNPHDDPNRAFYLLGNLGLYGHGKSRHACRAARRAAPRWRGRWRRGPTSCCWTSRPIIWTCNAIEWLEGELKAIARRAGADQP